jgi:hypothetical protein
VEDGAATEVVADDITVTRATTRLPEWTNPLLLTSGGDRLLYRNNRSLGLHVFMVRDTVSADAVPKITRDRPVGLKTLFAEPVTSVTTFSVTVRLCREHSSRSQHHQQQTDHLLIDGQGQELGQKQQILLIL